MFSIHFLECALVSAGLLAGAYPEQDNKVPLPTIEKSFRAKLDDTLDLSKVKTFRIVESTLPATVGDMHDKASELPSEISRLQRWVEEAGLPHERKFDEKYKSEFFIVKDYGYDHFRFELEESPSGKYVWIVFPCAKVPETGIPSVAMEGLMTKSGQMATAFFTYQPKTKTIFLKMPIATQSLNGLELKKQIDWLMKFANETRYLWDPRSWNKE